MEQNKEEKKNKASKPENGNKHGKDELTLVQRLVHKWKDTLGEFRKIIWPDRKALTKHTVNVIITSAIVGVVIVAMDYLFSGGYSLIIKLFQ